MDAELIEDILVVFAWPKSEEPASMLFRFVAFGVSLPSLGGNIEFGLMTCDAPFLYDRWMLSLLGLEGLSSGAEVAGLMVGCESKEAPSGGLDKARL